MDDAPRVMWEELLKAADGEVMISEALAGMGEDDLAAALRRAPTKSRNDFLGDLRLPQMRVPSPVVYRQALQRLVRKPGWFQRRASAFLAGGVLGALDVVADELNIGSDDVDLNREECEETVRALLDTLAEDVPVGLLRLAVAVAVAEDHRLAGPLLALATDGKLVESTGRRTVETKSNSDEQAMDQASDVDVGAGQLFANDRTVEEPGVGDDLEAALADELGDLFLSESNVARSEDPDIAELRQRVRAIDLDGAREAAEHILESVDVGARPAGDDLDALARFVNALDELQYQLVARTGERVPDLSVTGLEDALELLASQSRRDDEALLQRLANIEGPDGLARLVGEVREAAKIALAGSCDGPETEGLIALAEIIEAACVEEPDDERLMTLDERARTLLPQSLHLILMPAGRGRLRVPSADDVPRGSAKGAASPADIDADPPASAGAVAAPDDVEAARADAPSDVDTAELPADERADVSDVADTEPASAESLAATPDAPHQQPTTPAASVDEAVGDRAQAEGNDLEEAARAAGTPETVPWMTEDVRAAAARLVTEDRLGLASWLAQAGGASSGSVIGLRLAAYGHAMRTATGGCAGKLSELAGELEVGEIEGWPERLLAFVAAVRAALLAPFSGATALLGEMRPVVSSWPSLAAVADVAYQGALRGVQVVNASDAAMASVASIEAEVTDCIELAAETLRAGPTRTIKFHRATEIWHEWIAPNGLLGSLLDAVANDRRSDRAAVAESVLKLRNGKHVDKLLDDADRKHRSKSARAPVVAGARARLLERTVEVVEQVSAWLDAIDRLERFRASAKDAEWQQVPVAELRNQLRPHKDGALAELDDIAAEGDVFGEAACAVANRSLAATFSLFDGVPLPGDEPPVELVCNLELLKVTEVELDGLDPVGDVPMAGVLAVAAGREWVEAYEQREASGDHAATGLIVEAFRDLDPNLAITLSRRREEARRADEDRLRSEVVALRDDLARARRQGYVDDEAWSDFATRLETVASSSQPDLGSLRRGLGVLRDDLQRARAAASTKALERLAVLREASEEVGAVADRIETLLRDGHLATADEFLALAESGEVLPSGDRDLDPLEQFWPSLVEFVSTHGLVEATVQAASAGEVWEQVLDFSAVQPGRRELVARALKAWIGYRSGPKSGKYLGGLKDVLALAGIEADAESRPPEVRSANHRLWLDLTGVRRLGKALVPTFGTLAGGNSGERLRLLLVWGQPSAATLVEVVAQDTSQRPVLVLYHGVLAAGERRALIEIARRRRSSAIAVVDDAVVAFLASRAESRFDSMMGAILPFTAINPYTPRVAGDVPVEMFYGRTDEIHEIINPLGTSFIYGGRQLGKSSLLRAAARRFDSDGNQRALYLDLKREGIGRTRRPADVWDVLWVQLAQLSVVTGKKPQPRELAERLLAGVRDWLDARPDRRILLLLDECDDFLEADAADMFPTVSRLKGLLEETARRCKPVFAGLHQVQRFQHIPNQPLAHLGRPISVGPLRPEAAFDLLDRPMRALGYRFASDELVNRVLAYCNNQPSLLQLFGEALVNHLLQAPVSPGAPPHLVTEDDVESAYASRALMEEFRHRFELTLQLDLHYKVIAYAMAYNTHETGPATVSDPVELRADCERWWPKGFADMPSDQFRALLGEMVGLGVLSEVDGGFRMRSPNVLRMLGTSDQIAERLLDAETYPLPEPFQAASFRRPLSSGTHRSPLNEAQLTHLLARRNQCLVVAASPALGAADVAAALQGSTPRDDSLSTITVRGKTIPPASARPVAGKHRLVLADMTDLDAPTAAAAIGSAREAVARVAGDTLAIVALTAPRHAVLWAELAARGKGSPDAVRLVELRRWDVAGLRMWMRDTDLPFQDEDARRALLDATGGWPVLIDRVVDAVTEEGTSPHSALDTVVGGLATHEGASQLVTAAGVTAHAEVERVWATLVDFDEPAFHDELGELLVDEAGEQGAALVDVLRVLGALTATDDGRLFCEPVLAAAWRLAQTPS